MKENCELIVAYVPVTLEKNLFSPFLVGVVFLLEILLGSLKQQSLS